MDTLAHLAQGFAVAAKPINLLVALIGSFLGTIVGLLPGLGPINGVAILLPIAFALKLPPEACIAFEDSENGVKAAVAAHLKTVVTRNEYTFHHAFTGAALIVDDLGEPGRPAKIHASDQKSTSVVIDVPFLRTLVE